MQIIIPFCYPTETFCGYFYFSPAAASAFRTVYLSFKKPHGNVSINGELDIAHVTDPIRCQVIHPFEAQADGELNLTMDDHVKVRQV